MPYSPVTLLGSEHDLSTFDCDKPPLNEWLRRRALSTHKTGATRTWVITEGATGKVVAFYSSSTGAILRGDVPKYMARNQPEPIPAILLARMGVDVKHRAKGLGAALMKHFIMVALGVSQNIGLRLILVHAKDDEAKSFYEHYRFAPSPVDDYTLMMLVPGQQA